MIDEVSVRRRAGQLLCHEWLAIRADIMGGCRLGGGSRLAPALHECGGSMRSQPRPTYGAIACMAVGTRAGHHFACGFSFHVNDTPLSGVAPQGLASLKTLS